VTRFRQRGFTLVELLVALVLILVAMMGTLGLYNTATSANRRGDQLARGTRYGEEVMEDLRGRSVTNILAAPPGYPDKVAAGVTYHRAFTIADVAGKPNLVMVTVTITYGEDGDETASGLHTLVLQSLRTKVEQF
jgi:prepilin-type N-terminal cleavage/methylation domain-containing protein